MFTAAVPSLRMVSILLLSACALTWPLPAAAESAPPRQSHGRPSFVPAPEAIPADAATARAVLVREHRRSAPGTRRRADIDWVLRLGRAHGGPGEPAGRRRTVALTLRVNAWWYARRPAPAQRVIVRDPEGVLHTYWEGRGFAVNPVATTGRWQGLNAGLPPEALADALLPLGVRRHASGRSFTLWEYYDVPDVPATIRPGASGMAQARLAQLMARAYHRTGRRAYADAARAALAAFTVPVGRGGVTSHVAMGGAPAMPWYVERAYPGASPWRGAALNGFMVALLSLSTTADLLGSRPVPRATGPAGTRRVPRAPGARAGGALARGLADRGVATLVQHLPAHDTGAWSLYGLLTPGHGWRGFLADANYHCYHVTLLAQLERAWPGRGLGTTGERWSGYAARRGLDCAARR